MTNDRERFEKKGFDFNTAAGPQAVGDSVVSKRHRELVEAISGVQDRVRLGAVLTHKVSAAAGRMFEDPGLLRSASARRPWSLEQQSSGSLNLSAYMDTISPCSF